jgi:hypothetical protein
MMQLDETKEIRGSHRSYSHVTGFDSALKWFYKQRKVQLDENVKTRLKDFKSGIICGYTLDRRMNESRKKT